LAGFARDGFAPGEKEERIVQLAPDGRLMGLAHLIDLTAPGAPVQGWALAIAGRSLGA
jgi:hypothetical protein